MLCEMSSLLWLWFGEDSGEVLTRAPSEKWDREHKLYESDTRTEFVNKYQFEKGENVTRFTEFRFQETSARCGVFRKIPSPSRVERNEITLLSHNSDNVCEKLKGMTDGIYLLFSFSYFFLHLCWRKAFLYMGYIRFSSFTGKNVRTCLWSNWTEKHFSVINNKQGKQW
jgi:hypothetical protein